MTPVEDVKKVEKIRPVRSLDTKPTPPAAASQSMAKVISANSLSNIAIATPEEVVFEDSTDFGEQMSFDNSFGEDAAVVGTTSFFGEEISTERILYIIDFSGSMRGGRQELMRNELTKSVKKLPTSSKYQMIYFANDPWVAGYKLIVHRTAKQSLFNGYIDEQGKEVKKERGDIWKAEWRVVSDDAIKESVSVIKDSELLDGTNWRRPLEMAFEMRPLPETIIFMTDGLTSGGGTPMEIAEDYSSKAKRKGIVIHTVSLMEPSASDAMAFLAEETGGTFSLINKKGHKETILKKR